MLELLYPKRNHLIMTVVDSSFCTSNHMFGRAIWDKLPWCIFEKFKNHEGDLSQKSPEPKLWFWLITPNTLHRNYLLTAGNYE